MSEQEQLNISLVNEWSLDFVDDHRKLSFMNYSDGTVEIELENHKTPHSFNLSKDQKEYLIKWMQGND